MRVLKFFMFILFLGFSGVVTGDNYPFQERINQLDTLEGDALEAMVINIIEALSLVGDRQERIDITNRLFQKTCDREHGVHVYSLCYMAINSADTLRPELFDQAYSLALKSGSIVKMRYVEERKTLYYLSQHQYDSAMTYTLRLRDLNNIHVNEEEKRGIANLLGDIYLNTGLYHEAAGVYKDLYTAYAGESHWNYWRPYVVMNNLGTLAFKTGQTGEARYWFRHTIDTAMHYLQQDYRSNILAYSHIKLAEVMLSLHESDAADEQLQLAYNYLGPLVSEDVIQEYHYIHSRLMLSQGHTDEALQQAMLLMPSDTHSFTIYRFIPKIFKLLSEIYDARGQSDLSLCYAKKYLHQSDSIQNTGIDSRSMVILARTNHELVMQQLRQSKVRLQRLMVSVAILLVAMIIFLALYRRLYLSKLLLVKRSLESIPMVAHNMATLELKKENMPITPEEEAEMKKIIKKLTLLMKNKKVYLDPQCNIQEVARMIETNRTYLSRAINNQLNTTFPKLIRRYRVDESIRLITDGYTKTHTQDALAKECGFASSTVFISAFKRHTGVLPSFFIKNYAKPDTE